MARRIPENWEGTPMEMEGSPRIDPAHTRGPSPKAPGGALHPDPLGGGGRRLPGSAEGRGCGRRGVFAR